MQQKTQTLWARLLLLLFVVAGLCWLLHVDLGKKVSTDVLDLIPTSGRHPELALVRSIASERQARVVLFSVEVGAPEASVRASRTRVAAEALARHLNRSACFSEAVVMGGEAMRNTLAKGVFDRRLDLLFPQWLALKRAAYAKAGLPKPEEAEWIAEQASKELEDFLARPEAIPFQDLMPSDPLLLMAGLVESLGTAPMPGLSTEGLVWALQKESPLREEGQQAVFDAIDAAKRSVLEAEPAAKLRWTGVARFAAESRVRIQNELSLLNTLSLLAVVAVGGLCLSRVLPALNLVPPILIGLLGAWVATTAFFDHVHVLVFVVGSLLGGVAIDYGFYLYLQPPAYSGEPYASKVRRLAKPLLASALTTVLGFSLLLASELPLIRQLGVFVSAGLLCALGGAILWFGQVAVFHLPARTFVSVVAPPSKRLRTLARMILIVGLLVAVCGPWRLRWRDDIRELEIPAPALRDNDHALRVLFGEGQGVALYLTRGDTPAAAREAWTRFSAWQAAAFPDQGMMSLALVVPRESQWKALQESSPLLEHLGPAMQSALLRRGFEQEGFAPFFKTWGAWLTQPRPAYDPMVLSFSASLHGPVALLMSTSSGACWFASRLTLPDSGAAPDLPPELDTLGVSQLESLNRLFCDYRSNALHLSSIGLGLVGLSVFFLYGLRRGLRVFMIPVGSCLFCFGLLGFLGQTLNLFHLLGAFLGVCLSHNYAIFSTENSLRGEGVPPSIRLSALSTAVSFGVLALSQIPVVAALGTTVAMIVLSALGCVELGAILEDKPSVRALIHPPAP